MLDRQFGHRRMTADTRRRSAALDLARTARYALRPIAATGLVSAAPAGAPLTGQTSGVFFLFLPPGLVLAEKARQLGRKGLSARHLELLPEGVTAALELADVGLGLLVGRDRLAHLALVGLGGPLEVAELEREAEKPAEPRAERKRGFRARGERGVVRH